MDTLTLEDLDRIYKPANPLVQKKDLGRVDRHGRAFVALSPFCVVSSAGPDGRQDVSPRGGGPGFVHVSEACDEVFLPDRPGNNRLDIIRNLLAGSGKVGLMFMIPGFEDMYRVNGQASASDDPTLLARFEEFGKLPRLVIRVAVEEAYFHCPKAIMRARLWDPEAAVPRERLPTLSEMVMDQLDMGKPTVSEEAIIESNKRQL